MGRVIAKGSGKYFLCKIGLHNWGSWRVIGSVNSNVRDYEKKCKKCRRVKRKTKELD
ncbi:MAG: hypothetical protein ABEI74_04415 [Candidatus Pacearchaeota archaeon]